jgi:DNA-binding PadR family transcriptional regulator
MRANTFFSGLIRLHILHHAAREPLYGLWIIEELARHGYRLSPGTIYPILHDMERTGYLRSERQMADGRYRRLYAITSAGLTVLNEGRQKVQELFAELFEEE